MANGTIAFDTLQTSGQITGTAKSLDTDYVVNGSAKAWCHWNQDSTQTIRDSLGISSLDDDGVGDSFLNYTNAMSDANYVNIVNGSHFIGTAGGSVAYNSDDQSTSKTSEIRALRTDTSAVFDSQTMQSVLMGDLA
jgi:hypothetical protein|tara:strand:- start:39 stop:446 length:408 start_codon:yes stop_codon:yes gene_type:complete